jgi:hypothetical protein
LGPSLGNAGNSLWGRSYPDFCGRQVVTWGELYDATYMWSTHNFDIMFSLIRDECKDAGLSVSGLKRNKLIHLKEERLVQAGQGGAHHMCMLDLGRKSLATHPRDKIYGLLGMLGPSVVDLISPDCDSTLPEVFTNFAKAMIVASMSKSFPSARGFPNPSGPARTRLTTIGKITTLIFSKNALGQQIMVCRRGNLIGQTYTITVYLAVVQHITLPKTPTLFSISITMIKI